MCNYQRLHYLCAVNRCSLVKIKLNIFYLYGNLYMFNLRTTRKVIACLLLIYSYSTSLGQGFSLKKRPVAYPAFENSYQITQNFKHSQASVGKFSFENTRSKISGSSTPTTYDCFS